MNLGAGPILTPSTIDASKGEISEEKLGTTGQGMSIFGAKREKNLNSRRRRKKGIKTEPAQANFLGKRVPGGAKKRSSSPRENFGQFHYKGARS